MALAACGGGDETSNPDAGDPGADASPDPRFGQPRVGFEIYTVMESDGVSYNEAANAFGIAYEVQPPVYHSEVSRVGSCRQLTFEPSQCTPSCDGVCLPGNVCDPFPTFESAGEATVTGLKQNLQFTEFDGRYSPASQVSTDLFDQGDNVVLTLAGAGGADGVTLTAQGVAPLDANFAPVVTLVDGGDQTFQWSEGAAGDRVRLILRSANAAHGLPMNTIIECDGPDTGSFTVPQAMIEAFPLGGGSPICASVDCPNSELIRYRADSADYDGATAELSVSTRISFVIQH